jgi:phosphoglycolate phosphatase
MRKVEAVHQRFIKEGKIDSINQKNLEFLDTLKKSGRKLAIVTSRSLQEVRHLLHVDHPLNSRIERLYHKDNSVFLKPDPRVFDQVLKDFAVQADEAVYLGDSLGDAISAKGAGLHFIAVLESGLKTSEDFTYIPVDFFATTLPEAFAYITSH